MALGTPPDRVNPVAARAAQAARKRQWKTLEEWFAPLLRLTDKELAGYKGGFFAVLMAKVVAILRKRGLREAHQAEVNSPEWKRAMKALQAAAARLS